MAKTHVEKEINAPADKVWALLTDLPRWGEWNTMLTKWKTAPPAEVTADTEAAAVLTIMGMANTITLTVAELVPGQRLTLSGTGMAGAKITLTLAVADTGGASRASLDAEFVSQMMVGAIGGAIERAAKKELDASLVKAAALVE